MEEKHIKISRSGLKLFEECQRCFWLNLHHKIKRPPGYPYTLSGAVDYLVKPLDPKMILQAVEKYGLSKSAAGKDPAPSLGEPRADGRSEAPAPFSKARFAAARCSAAVNGIAFSASRKTLALSSFRAFISLAPAE